MSERNIWQGYGDDYDWWHGTVGSISPFEAVAQAREAGQPFDAYAADYRAHWPFPESEPDDDLEDRMAAIMQRAADAASAS